MLRVFPVLPVSAGCVDTQAGGRQPGFEDAGLPMIVAASAKGQLDVLFKDSETAQFSAG